MMNPPTVFNALFIELERSTVKLAAGLGLTSVLEQASNKQAAPLRATIDLAVFKKSLLSIFTSALKNVWDYVFSKFLKATLRFANLN